MGKKEYVFSLTKKDFEIQTFRSGGKGGQHQNKTSSGVRIIHKASGARGECREDRHQHNNKATAFKRLTETDLFQRWLKVKVAEAVTGETIDDKVERDMHPSNLEIECVGEDGEWARLEYTVA